MRNRDRGLTLLETIGAMAVAAIVVGAAVAILGQLETQRAEEARLLDRTRRRAAALEQLRVDLRDTREQAADLSPVTTAVKITGAPGATRLELRGASVVWRLDGKDLFRGDSLQLDDISGWRVLLWDDTTARYSEPSAATHGSRALPQRVKAYLDGASVEVDLR